ncbi:MAG: radical SAM protein [Burkholderiales bacterium]
MKAIADMLYLTSEQIANRGPLPLPDATTTPLLRARGQVQDAGLWTPTQHMGRRWSIGCVALEITQRCNLDCTLCYLSENSEATKDVPLEEVFRRIDMIRDYYGAHTDVQVTGGDPTLRERGELLAIVRRVKDRGLRPSLFTNGIKATRELLQELSRVGLVDVAFHVDMTQERNGYACEVDLNRLRSEYIERARGLPLSVIFNTTVFDGNFAEIPAITKFFVENSDVVRLASFQLQADIGRGVLHERGFEINLASTVAQLRDGAGARLNFDAASAGHPACNRFAVALVANGKAYDALDEPEFIAAFTAQTLDLQFDRTRPGKVLLSILVKLLARPRLLVDSLGWLLRKAWAMKADLIRARRRYGKLTLFVHNFMDACHLEPQRIDACAFMVVTQDGPLSMCLHNAKRDQYVLEALPIRIGGTLKYWNPLNGKLEAQAPAKTSVQLTRKNARGRARLALRPGVGTGSPA